MPESLFEDIVVPVASKEDAAETAMELTPYVGNTDSVTAVYVVEKAGGAPDKASVEQKEEYAEEIFGVFEREFADAGVESLVETQTLYGTDVAKAIFDYALESGASAVVFVPRSSGSLIRLLTGDVAHSLITENDIPVVVLPSDENG
ncbi:MAG: universal stress protein [Halobacteria archaeon]|nr:universal stress protein [Halobacteria archaeon]